MVEPMLEQFQKLKNSGKTASKIGCDNAGENKTLQERCGSANWKFPAKFEFAARATPQQNACAKNAFTALHNKGRALVTAANMPVEHQFRLFAQAFEHAADPDGLIVETVDGVKQTRHEHFYGNLPNCVDHVKTWGTAGTATVKSKASGKSKDRGTICVFVGCAKDHAGDTCLMWSKNTSKARVTRDVIWLRRMCFPTPPRRP